MTLARYKLTFSPLLRSGCFNSRWGEKEESRLRDHLAPVAFLHNKGDERMGLTATPGACRANTPVARVNVNRCDILRQNWDLISNAWSAIRGFRTAGFCFFTRSSSARPRGDTRVLGKPKLTTSCTDVMTTRAACLYYKHAFLRFLNNSGISVSLISTASFQVFIRQSCLI